MVRLRIGLTTLFLFATSLFPAIAGAQPSTAGKILIAGDENWTAINDATTFALATNIAEFLAPGGTGKFLFHIENSLPWLKGEAFLQGLTRAGNVITDDGGPPDSFAHNLLEFDAVFVARQYASDTVVPTAELIAYVQSGGNVFVSLGSGLRNDTGANEATAWKPFLNTFGLDILPLYHNLVGNIPIVSIDPIMNFVSSLYHNVGSTITLTGADPNARIIATYPGQPAGEGLFGVYEVPLPKELLARLVADIRNLNLRAGISNAFDAKLDAALAALDDTREQNDGAATNAMHAFINSVNGQRGRQLTDAQANSLVSAAERIIRAIGS